MPVDESVKENVRFDYNLSIIIGNWEFKDRNMLEIFIFMKLLSTNDMDTIDHDTRAYENIQQWTERDEIDESGWSRR